MKSHIAFQITQYILVIGFTTQVHQTMGLQLLKGLFRLTILNNGFTAIQATILNHRLSKMILLERVIK